MSKYKVVCGDHLQLLTSLKGRFQFAFADPHFNIDHPYVGFVDKVGSNFYRSQITHLMYQLWESLDSKGVMAMHGNDYLCELYLRIAYERQMHRIAWVYWTYKFGQHKDTNWIDGRCHCLIFARDPQNWTWNPDAVLVDSVRLKGGDKRVESSPRKGKRVPSTVWGTEEDGPYWGRVQGNNEERRQAHPNQLPEVYLKRLILAYTNPGDKIIDPCGGSGTTAVQAMALGRDCYTIDISPDNCESILDRIKKGAVR